MKCRFVGDVGDFGKYGLLRAISGITVNDEHRSLRLGVMWYLVPDDGKANSVRDEPHRCPRPARRLAGRGQAGEGKFIGYLAKTSTNRRRFRECDEELYDALAEIVSQKGRCVANVADDGILGADAALHDEPLTYADLPRYGSAAKETRLTRRKEWFQRALEAVRGCDVVFVDPDNGLECKSVERHHAKGPKYAYLEDLNRIADRGHSLLVYHHLSRNGRHREQIEDWRERISAELGLSGDRVLVAWCKPYAGRAFFIIPSQRDREVFDSRFGRFKASKWCEYGHFECL